MNLNKFLLQYPKLIATDHGESEFAAMRVLCPGLSTPKLGKILNTAVSCMSRDEVYCEIGTFVGYTLISASHGNSDKICIGIDNFRLVGIEATATSIAWAKERLKINLEHFKYGNQRFIEADFRDVDIKEKVGVFYIDGHHTREEVYENFRWGHNKLSDNAVVLVDDITMPGIGEGITDWIKDHPEEYREVFHMDVFHTADNVNHYNNIFWNGLSIVTFKRSGATLESSL